MILAMDADEDQLIDEPTLLKALLKLRHWQKLGTFAHQWNKVAKTIDSRLVGTCPAHAQFYRWLGGNIRRMPHPDACRILEAMFPGWTVQQLFRPVRTSRDALQSTLIAKSDSNENAVIPARQLRDPGATGEEAWAKVWDVRSKIANLDLLSDGGKPLGMSRREFEGLARLTGRVVELDTVITVDISDDGHAVVEYDRLILNLMDRPVSSLSWGIWFKYAYDKLSIMASGSRSHNTKIIVKHDTVNLAKFATLVSPSISPGSTARISYSCHGGLFTDNLYWRQSIPWDVRHFTLTVRQRVSDELLSCRAMEELPDGSERSAMDGLTWDTADGCHTVRVTRDYLERNQAITISWELDR
jgi:hypothetical protein